MASDLTPERIAELRKMVGDQSPPYEFIGMLFARHGEALLAAAEERDRLRVTVRDWLAANSPGGWIDKLRVQRDALAAAGQTMMEWFGHIESCDMLSALRDGVEGVPCDCGINAMKSAIRAAKETP